MFQEYSREIAAHGIEYHASMVQHELCHWYQCMVLGEAFTSSSTNVHRRLSWSQACHLATQNLWPELNLPL